VTSAIVGAICVALTVLVGWGSIPYSNYGPIGPNWAWVIAAAVAATPLLFLAGLSSRWTGAQRAGDWFAAFATLLIVAVWIVFWNGGLDLLAVAIPAVGLAWLAHWFGWRLSTGR